MNRFKMLLIGALMTAGSALATAQPYDHDGRGDRDGGGHSYRDRDRRFYGDRDDHRFYRDRDDRRFVRDRDDWRSYRDRDDRRFFVVGERRFFNGYYWTWDGNRWCRRDGRLVVYFRF